MARSLLAELIVSGALAGAAVLWLALSVALDGRKRR